MIEAFGIRDFDPDHTFDCGQCFRWDRQTDGSYTGITAGRPPVNIAFYPDYDVNRTGRLVIDNADKSDFDEFWSGYLDLGRDYGFVKSELSKDSVITQAIEYGHGIRILKQDKWETLISFIISQNNNIKRIKGCINSLCENYGRYMGEYRGKKYFDIPSPDILAGITEDDLAPCMLGYRARYIIEAAKSVCEDSCEKLFSLDGADEKEAFAYLTGLCGVGPKVANCIMLFSMEKYASFPIDVWVRRAMNRLYKIDENDIKAMARYAEEKFGGYGGFAQQYLFYYMKSLKV